MKKFPIMLVRATRQVWGKTTSFSDEKKLFGAFKTFAKAFLWHKRWGVGVTSANFCITSGEKKSKVMKEKFPWKSVVLAFETIEKAFLWHERWGGGVTSATFCITRGDESAQRAPSDAKSGTSDTTPSPRVTQKGLFKGREGKNEWFSAAKFFFTASIFAVSATNVIGYFFILVKGFCNRLFFYFIGFGRYKAAAGGFEKGVKPFWL